MSAPTWGAVLEETIAELADAATEARSHAEASTPSRALRYRAEAGDLDGLATHLRALATALEGVTEDVAHAIYEAMRANDPEGVRYPWVPRGNSDKQDEARRRARLALGLLATDPAAEVPAHG